MRPQQSNRLAWSVAVASLALWAVTAPVTWGQQVATGANGLFDQADPGADITTLTTTTTTTEDSQLADSPIAACPTPMPSTPVVATGPRTFTICGADSGIERDIEQLIGGHGFSATLNSHGGSCAELTIRPTAQISSGSSSSNLSVSLGSGQTLSIQIVSDPGGTHATITVR